MSNRRHRNHSSRERLALGTHSTSCVFEPLEERRLMSATLSHGLWNIRGDMDRANPNDVIVIEHSQADPTMLQATINGQVVDTRAESKVRIIRVSAGRGDDQVTVDLGDTTTIPVVIYGGAGNDTLTGGAGADRIYGQAGNDIIDGSAGNDKLYGGSGNDTLTGGRGDDRLYGGWGMDTLRGSDGIDYLAGEGGVDTVYFEPDRDRIRVSRLDVKIHEIVDPIFDPTCPVDPTPIGPVVIDAMRIKADDALKQQLIDGMLQRWGSLLGQPARGWYGGMHTFGPMTLATITSTTNSISAADYSGTNNQVQGVEEGDLVKTDGQYIYMVSGQDLLVIDARQSDELTILSRTNIGDAVQAIYVDGDQVTVISQRQNFLWPDWPIFLNTGPRLILSEPLAMDVSDIPSVVVSPDGRSLWRQSPGPQVKVTVLDMSDRQSPVVTEQTTMTGQLITSREIDGRVYVVLDSSTTLPGPRRDYNTQTQQYEYESRESYIAHLEQALDSYSVPSYATTTAGQPAHTGALVTGARLYIPQGSDGTDILSIVTFNVTDDSAGPDSTISVMGADGQVYASLDSMYIASRSGNYALDGIYHDSTQIMKFGLGQDQVDLQASGTVPGHLVDQFSMDEYNGDFRIATTQSGQWSDVWHASSNNVFVLRPDGSDLTTVGSVTGLAPGESIYSVRFMGDQAYVVTFRQTDPLFTLDMSDPTNPQVMGELVLPGFSNYLHPMGENYLLGLGRSANAETGLFGGLQMSLFDVSDFANPLRVDVQTLGDDSRNDSSLAIGDHHAFSFFEETGLLAIPIHNSGTYVWDGHTNTLQGVSDGLQLLKVDSTGIESLGTIEHDSRVLRSLRIGENLISISQKDIKVSNLANPAAVIDTLALPDSSAVIAF